MIVTLLSIYAAIGLSFGAPRGHGVGNGGDGYYFQDSGKIYLRDLVESGRHLQKIDGQNFDPRFVSFDWPMFSTDDEKHKIAVKLTEINAALPGLGDAIAGVARAYTWYFVTSPLAIIEHEEGLLDPVPGAEIRQIANRLGTIVRVHRESWNRMNVENRVALVFHESIEAMLTPQMQKNGWYAQSNIKARELTGLLFHENLVDEGPRLMKYAFVPELRLPWTDLRAYRNTGPASLALQLRIGNSVVEDSSVQIFTSKERARISSEICEAIDRRNARSTARLRLQTSLRPFDIEMQSYAASFGPQAYPVLKSRAQDNAFQLVMSSDVPNFNCRRDLVSVLSELTPEI